MSYELMALRLVIPVSGAGAQTAAIIISAVLFALALGYLRGGNVQKNRSNIHMQVSSATEPNRTSKPVRNILVRNIALSIPFIVCGSSIIFCLWFFDVLANMGIESPLLRCAIYAVLIVAPPVYFLGQSVPLLSVFFRQYAVSKTAGIILCVSTLGSLMGALLTTLVLMPFLGVHNAAIILLFNVVLLCALLTPKRQRHYLVFCTLCACGGITLNLPFMMQGAGIKANNVYHTVQIEPVYGAGDVMYLNRSAAASYDAVTGKKWPYVEYVEKNFIYPATQRLDGTKPLNILAIGAGGFTLGSEDEFNVYDYIDIDGQLKELAEEHLLRKKLGKNKAFHAQPIRRFLSSNKRKYDLVFIDVYYGVTIPDHLITVEFFTDVKNVLNPNGAVVMNIIADASFESAFSRNIYATFSDVFWPNSREILGGFDAGIGADSVLEASKQNIMHVYIHNGAKADMRLYLDAKNKGVLEGR